MNISFRSFNDDNDFIAMYKIREESNKIDQVDPLSTCEDQPSFEEIKKSFSNVSGLQERLIIMLLEENIIGYSKITWWKEADGTFVYLHNDYLLPVYRNNEILQKFIEYIERHIYHLSLKQNTLEKAFFGVNVSETEKYKADSFLLYGYQLVWTMVEMEFTNFNNLLVAPLPDSISIRQAKEDDFKEIWAINKAVYKDTWGTMPADENDFKEFIDDNLNRLDLCTVALENNSIVGFVLATTAKGVGTMLEVTIAKQHQKRGIGKALLTRNLAMFPKNGITKIRLHTDAENKMGGRSLYEKIGFYKVKYYLRYRKPVQKSE